LHNICEYPVITSPRSARRCYSTDRTPYSGSATDRTSSAPQRHSEVRARAKAAIAAAQQAINEDGADLTVSDEETSAVQDNNEDQPIRTPVTNSTPSKQRSVGKLDPPMGYPAPR